MFRSIYPIRQTTLHVHPQYLHYRRDPYHLLPGLYIHLYYLHHLYLLNHSLKYRLMINMKYIHNHNYRGDIVYVFVTIEPYELYDHHD
eukprot:UN14629